ADRRAARAVGAAGHVEQVAGVRVWVRGREVGAARGTGQRVYGRDDRRRGTGSAVHRPAGRAIGLVHGNPGVGVGHGGDVRLGPPGAVGGHRLPGRLGVVRGTTRSRAAPGCFGPAPGVAGGLQAGAADRCHIPGGGRVLRAGPVVTRADRDGHTRVVEVRVVG